MVEDTSRIVKVCAQVGQRSISRVMTNCPTPPNRRGQGHLMSKFFAK